MKKNLVKEFDENGNLIHYKSPIGSEWWYDEKGNCIHYKNSNGTEYWYDYDANGNGTYYRDSEYNKNDICICCSDTSDESNQ